MSRAVADPKRSVVVASAHLGVVLAVAEAAEGAGLHRIWTTESTGSDAVVRAQQVLQGTQRIGVATGIAYAFTRLPVAAAVTAAELQSLGAGRFSLGLGAGTRGVRRRYGAEFDHPAPRLAEYARLVKAALAARSGLAFEGRFYRCEAPQFALPHDVELLGILEVYGAALQPTMAAHLAASCDGVALHSLALCDPVWEERTLPALRRGAEEAGRWPKVAAWVIVAVDEDEEAGRALARRQLGFYLSTPSYGATLSGTPFEQSVRAIESAAAEGAGEDSGRLARAIPEAMVDALCIAGTAVSVRRRLGELGRRLGPAGVDELVVQVVSGAGAGATLENGLRVVEASAPFGPEAG